jgi:hypothetical protein
MRIDAANLVNGIHTDGTLTVKISGLGSPVAGIPDSFEWEADRPIALVIIRSGVDGEDVDFAVGPGRHGLARAAQVSDGSGIGYVAFCYDAAPDAAASPVLAVEPENAPVLTPVPLSVPAPATPPRRRLAASRAFAPTGRDRRSILALLLQGSTVRRATT